MARILMAWEYGSGYGHVAMLAPLAGLLCDAGHEVVMALRRPSSAPAALRSRGIRVIEAPYVPFEKFANVAIHTLADVLFHAGMREVPALREVTRRWQAILADFRPELVVNELAPTLALSTLGRIPTVSLGTGYSTPPAGHMLPGMRFWQRAVPQSSTEQEAALLEAMQGIRASLQLPALDYVADLFAGAAQFVCTYPLLDCYAEFRSSPALGPLDAAHYAQPNARQSRREPRAFAYLNAELADPSAILAGIGKSGIAAEAYVRGKPVAALTSAGDRIVLHDKPQDMQAVLARCSVFIHHGGIASAEQCLRHGVPQLLLPNHLEQRLNVSALGHAGVGEVLPPPHKATEDAVAEALVRLARKPEFSEKARQLSADLVQRYPRSRLADVSEACLSLV